MLPRFSGQLGVIAALAAAVVTCKGNPVAEGAGTPFQVQADFLSINVKNGSSSTVTAWVVDQRMNRLEVGITFAACNAGVATVGNDATYKPAPATSQRAVVTGVSVGTTCAVVSSSGLKPDTVGVTVTP
jgi:flagellar basal body rod protein FlgG